MSDHRTLARVVCVQHIRPHPSAEHLDIVQVAGWQVVVRKAEFKPNNLVVFLEPDSWVPRRLAPFLCGPVSQYFCGIDGARLRTIRLRGEYSQGLLLSISHVWHHFPKHFQLAMMRKIQQKVDRRMRLQTKSSDQSMDNDTSPAPVLDDSMCCLCDDVPWEEDDVTQMLGVVKWESLSEMYANMGFVDHDPDMSVRFTPFQVIMQDQKNLLPFPSCIPLSHVERVQNLKNPDAVLQTSWEITEKLDGSNCTMFFDPDTGEFTVCSRNHRLHRPPLYPVIGLEASTPPDTTTIPTVDHTAEGHNAVDHTAVDGGTVDSAQPETTDPIVCLLSPLHFSSLADSPILTIPLPLSVHPCEDTPTLLPTNLTPIPNPMVPPTNTEDDISKDKQMDTPHLLSDTKLSVMTLSETAIAEAIAHLQHVPDNEQHACTEALDLPQVAVSPHPSETSRNNLPTPTTQPQTAATQFPVPKPIRISPFWFVAKKFDIEAKLRHHQLQHLALHGEVVGPRIHENPYNLEDFDYYIFQIFHLQERRYLSPVERRLIVAKLQLPHVPVLHTDYVFPEPLHIPSVLHMAQAPSAIHTQLDREGIVFKPNQQAPSCFPFKVIAHYPPPTVPATKARFWRKTTNATQ